MDVGNIWDRFMTGSENEAVEIFCVEWDVSNDESDEQYRNIYNLSTSYHLYLNILEWMWHTSGSDSRSRWHLSVSSHYLGQTWSVMWESPLRRIYRYLLTRYMGTFGITEIKITEKELILPISNTECVVCKSECIAQSEVNRIRVNKRHVSREIPVVSCHVKITSSPIIHIYGISLAMQFSHIVVLTSHVSTVLYH